MNYHKKYVFRCLLAIAALLSAASFQPALAQTAPPLGTASNFSVLSADPTGGGAVTCTDSFITGDVGSSGGAAAVVSTRCAITGAIIAPVSAQVLTDFNNAYNTLANTPCTQLILAAAFTGNAPPLGPLAPGVYCFPAGAGVAFTDTTLTLDGSTNPNGIWIFKVGAALAGSGFQVVMANGGQPCNVFWSVGAATTLTTSTLPPLFQGNIFAGAAITVTGGAVVGRALAKAAVTLTSTNIGTCALVDQAKASCKAKKSCKDDDGEHHRHHGDRDKDRDDDKDCDKDRDHNKDRDKDKDQEDRDH